MAIQLLNRPGGQPLLDGLALESGMRNQPGWAQVPPAKPFQPYQVKSSTKAVKRMRNK